MSTHCIIGIEYESGEIHSVYCHHDGYPEYVGVVLDRYYKDKETVEKLMDVGDMSSIGVEPIDTGFSVERQHEDRYFYDSCEGYRSRGDDNVDYEVHDNRDDFVARAYDEDAEYAYLLTNDGWLEASLYYSEDFNKLKDAIDRKE